MNINDGYKTDAGRSRDKTRSTHRGRQLTGVYTTVENLATILQCEHLVHGFSFDVIRLVSPP